MTTPQLVDVERFDLHGVSYVRSTDHDARIAAMLLQVAAITELSELRRQAAECNMEMRNQECQRAEAAESKLAERDAEIKRLRKLADTNGRLFLEADTAQSAAEGARDDACGLLREVDRTVIHDASSDLPDRIAAFLAANGGSDG